MNYSCFKKLNFYRNAFKFSSPCLSVHKNHFMNYSYFKNQLELMMNKIYNVNDILDNCKDALKSRIYFVQNILEERYRPAAPD